ncbi:MAG: dockerin type I repeat-containing protein, partial [Oscillospiraceae bacterium]|nr:dockerin type I repeat-containing protein [Oscillospiraceae bacterium]
IKNAGVKQADPNFKLAMGGLLTTASMLDYLSQMKLWFDYNRTDGRFAVDIINVHLGPDTYNPEDSGMVKRIQEIRNWINQNAPGTELWISEFEIPMGDCEIEGTDNHENETYQLRYAQRVARTYLAAIGAGVDRMTKFQLRDEGEGVYYNSGLVTQKGKWSKKLAWYYVSCMTNALRDTYFAADMSEPDDPVKRYFFINQCTGSSVYCLWLPTNSGQEIPDYQLAVPQTAQCRLTVPGTYAEGVTTALEVKDGTVTLPVSETPVFVTISSDKQQIINGRGRYIRPAQISTKADFSAECYDLPAEPETAALKPFYRMFDEPDSMPEYIYGDTEALPLPETAVKASDTVCYVKLDRPYVLDDFGVYDTYGTGSIAVYDARTDRLLWSSGLGSYMSRSLELRVDSAPTDYLKIVKGGGEMNELALYGYPAPDTLRGDVNADGVFDSRDLAALTDWLLTRSSAPAAPSAGDLCADGILNAADLAAMKRELAG